MANPTRTEPDATVADLRIGLATGGAAMERAYQRLTDVLLLVARRCTYNLEDPACAPEDVVQEAWARSFARLREIVAEPDCTTRNVTAFMATIVRRTAKDVMKRKPTRLRESVGGHLTDFAAATGVITRLFRQERHSEVLQVIDELPATYRDAWLLRNVEGTAIAESAAILGITEVAFRKRVQRAAEMLRAALQGTILDELT